MRQFTLKMPDELYAELQKQADMRYTNKTHYIYQLILEKKKEREENGK